MVTPQKPDTFRVTPSSSSISSSIFFFCVSESRSGALSMELDSFSVIIPPYAATDEPGRLPFVPMFNSGSRDVRMLPIGGPGERWPVKGHGGRIFPGAMPARPYPFFT